MIEFRACRKKDGTLGCCKEPELRKDMCKLEIENIILSLIIFVCFVFSLAFLLEY